MSPIAVRRWLGVCVLAVCAGAVPMSSASAQQVTGGFDVTLEPNATGDELRSQTNLWAMQVSFKPMRMILADITDPQTGKKERELIWYLCYKAVNRPLAQQSDASDTAPVNVEDKPPVGPLFIPEFTLVTNDNGRLKLYDDVILPEAQAEILEREQRNGWPKYKNAVAAIGEVPAPTESGSDENAIYGIAMWRAVDAETDFFTVFMGGFSNGYKVVDGPGGDPLVLRRTIVQEFWRPGDKYDPREVEIRRKGDPVWQYRPDAPKQILTASEPVQPGGFDPAEPPAIQPQPGAAATENNETP